ncbi:hypothetical protein COV94_02295 [Candidatus Woesearchaeota archaeon CG11_big_fil_rev_8_21_14_0_20_57_5]|nr:MAG: hypothetical protein COV94_02295 [Candidatus Woesearchaeota archaeon CG11_big_fil_rev_8_21_14_0_20_57_5]
MSEVKEVLQAVQKRDDELSFRGQKTYEYLGQFKVLGAKQAAELRKKLEALSIPRLREQHISKIMDLLPGTLNECKNVLQGYTLTVTQDNMKKIVKVVAEFKK